MKTSYILIGLVVAVVVIGGVFALRSDNNSQAPALGNEENIAPPATEEASQPSHTVVYSDAGYFPKELTIKKGDTITFKNESSIPMWTASAVHPTHMAYPNTDIKNCGNSAMMSTMFDACSGTAAGSNWMFQFNEAGSWGYHNHMRADHTGKIIVQ